jgi:hypothetical protein
MAEVNYTNPASLAPQVPAFDGFLGGMQAYDKYSDYRNQTDISHYLSQLGAINETIKTGEFMRDAPVRESKSLADIATNNATAANIGDIKAGEGAEGKFKKQTLPTKVDEFVRDALFKKQGQDRETFLHNADLMGSLSEEIMGIPPGVEGTAARKDVWDQYKEQYPGLKLPEYSEEHAYKSAMIGRSLRKSVEQQRKLELIRATGQEHLAAGEQQQQGRVDAATIAAEAHVEAARIAAAREQGKLSQERREAAALERVLRGTPQAGDEPVASAALGRKVNEEIEKDPYYKVMSQFANPLVDKDGKSADKLSAYIAAKSAVLWDQYSQGKLANPYKKEGGDAKVKFDADPKMNGFTMGTLTPKGYEVRDKSNKLVGYYK